MESAGGHGELVRLQSNSTLLQHHDRQGGAVLSKVDKTQPRMTQIKSDFKIRVIRVLNSEVSVVREDFFRLEAHLLQTLAGLGHHVPRTADQRHG
jgi:hypothetical protein